jgi:4-amino-4-deoxy-L-arabinose transferase-like glycosyltransferase
MIPERNELRTSWHWILLCIALVVMAIWSRPPIPIDETRYLSVAWEMWQSNQFLVPHINGQPFSHKPPLLFWLMHFGWWLFGVNEWSARLTPPLFGLTCLFLTQHLAGILWPTSPNISRTSPLLLLGMGVWTIFCTLTMFDTMVVFFSLTAYLIILSCAKNPSRYSWPFLGCILGFGLLAKGPVTLVYIIPPTILAPLWITDKNFSWRRWYRGFVFALAIGILLVLLWAVPAALAGGQKYGYAIFFGQTAGRMAQSFAHQRPFYWYLLLLPLILFPWSFWLPFWRGWKIPGDQSLRFCFCILVPAFLIFSLISGKQIHYILPLLPIIAILLSRIADASSSEKLYDIWLYVLFFTVLALLLFVLPAFPVLGKDAEIVKNLSVYTRMVPLCVGLALLGFWNCRKAGQGLTIISVCMVVHLILLQMTLSPSLHTLFNPAEVISSLSSAEKTGKAIAVYPANLADQFQFAARLTKPLVTPHNIPELQAWAKNNPTGYCLVSLDDRSLWLFGKTTKPYPYKDRWLLFGKVEELGLFEQPALVKMR